MGTMSDIIDFVVGVKRGISTKKGQDFTIKTTRNSISRRSSNSILQFPVICSSALSPDDMMMINKALEREYAQFIRVAASLDDVIDMNDPAAKEKKLRSLHQNIGYRGQGSLGISGNGSFNINGNVLRNPFNESANMNNMKYTTLCEQFRVKNIELLKIANEDLNMTTLNDMTNRNNRNFYTLGEAKRVEDMTDDELKRATNEVAYKRANASSSREKDKELRDIELHNMKVRAEQREEEMHRARMNQLTASAPTEPLNMKANFGDQLLATDVKKANELVPTMMNLEFIYKAEGVLMKTNIIVGVKTVCHLVTSDEMMTNVASAVKDKRHFFRFLQWTTGEIEMVKDWIFAKDKIREEVKRQRNGKESVWWRRLKQRSTEERIARMPVFKKELLPNSTLVLTMDEVEMIQNNYNINILKDDRAKLAIFKTFFLLGLVIVDPAAELAYFAFDGNEDFQVQSYRSLEKESSSAADMKALISLVDKQGR